MSHEMPSKDTLDCMKTCGECALMCAQCGHHCLHMGGQHASPEHQGIMQDCASICATAACFMSRNSHHAPRVCGECVDICMECAESCDKLAKGDAMMKECAELCRSCAKACEKMAGAAV
jgi:hypothetical protein